MDAVPARPVLRVRSTADLLALVPVTLGFEPEESLVVIATAGAQPGFQARVDLPRRGDAGAVASQVAHAVAIQGCTEVAVAAFSRRADPADRVLRAAAEGMRAAGVEVLDLLRTDGERYWSLLCTDEQCCPPGGIPFDPRATAVRAEAVVAGLTVAPNRAALASRYAAVSGRDRADARLALRAAEGEVLAVLGLRGGRQLRRMSARAVRAAAPAGAARVGAILDALDGGGGLDGRGGEDPVELQRVADAVTAEQAATLAVWCSLTPVRDLAWSRMTRSNANTQLAIWAAVSRRVVSPYEPAVLGLTAFAAWLSGDGASAWCVLDRCAAVAPGYSMAGLVADALQRCVSPTRWEPIPLEAVREACGLEPRPEPSGG